MTTVTATIRRSLRLIRVLDAIDTPRAEDYQVGEDALNAMLARWEANGLALGWSAVSDPESTLPAPEEAHDAIAYNLALRLAPEFGLLPSPDIVETARDTLADLRRDRLVSAPLRQPSDLPRSHGYWNITTDEPV